MVYYRHITKADPPGPPFLVPSGVKDPKPPPANQTLIILSPVIQGINTSLQLRNEIKMQ